MTNRNRISRSKIVVEDWMPKWLLDGTCEPKIKPYIYPAKGLPFCNNWLPMWEEIRDEILPAWRAAHPGELCFAEKQIIADKQFEAELLLMEDN